MFCFPNPAHSVWNKNYETEVQDSLVTIRRQSTDPKVATAALRIFAGFLGRGFDPYRQPMTLLERQNHQLLQILGQPGVAERIRLGLAMHDADIPPAVEVPPLLPPPPAPPVPRKRKRPVPEKLKSYEYQLSDIDSDEDLFNFVQRPPAKKKRKKSKRKRSSKSKSKSTKPKPKSSQKKSLKKKKQKSPKSKTRRRI